MNIFRERSHPVNARPVGYGALVERYDLRVPLPRPLQAVADRHHPASTDDWVLLEPRRDPGDKLGDHLVFALKHEGIRLDVLKVLFDVVPERELADIVFSMPTGRHTRRLWFLYEWLTDRKLDIMDTRKVAAVPLLDARLQFAVNNGEISTRHRVLNNLPGTRRFCPLVYRTGSIAGYLNRDLAGRARDEIGRVHPDVVARAAAFLLLGDSRASFQIEGETPSRERTLRWARAIGEAGSSDLTIAELERLQDIVIGDHRFVKPGLRNEGGFIGQHDRVTGEPIPEHISARPADLPDLLEGVIEYAERSVAGNIDPIVAAAAVAFGFVFIHPFEDGNGRIHRWLIHHLLAKADFNPAGVVFPISSAILNRIDEYRSVLQSHSRSLLPFIQWQPTRENNVDVTNETADHYRYFDATCMTDFLFRCVEQTVEHDLPAETDFLERYDRFVRGVHEFIEMPDRTVNLLHRFLDQTGGKLSKRARQREFEQLTDAEVQMIERLYAEQF
ncbi:Fic family protein [Bacteroidota bacterium]